MTVQSRVFVAWRALLPTRPETSGSDSEGSDPPQQRGIAGTPHGLDLLHPEGWCTSLDALFLYCLAALCEDFALDDEPPG